MMKSKGYYVDNKREQVIPFPSLVLLPSGFDYASILFKRIRASFQESPVSKRSMTKNTAANVHPRHVRASKVRKGKRM